MKYKYLLHCYPVYTFFVFKLSFKLKGESIGQYVCKSMCVCVLEAIMHAVPGFFGDTGSGDVIVYNPLAFFTHSLSPALRFSHSCICRWS